MRSVRRVAIADISDLFFVPSVRGLTATLAELAEHGVTPETLAGMFRDKRFRNQRPVGWIAQEDGQPLGFVIARASRADVFALFVLPHSRGLGIGTWLLAEAELWLSSRGVARARLRTAAGTAQFGVTSRKGPLRTLSRYERPQLAG